MHVVRFYKITHWAARNKRNRTKSRSVWISEDDRGITFLDVYRDLLATVIPSSWWRFSSQTLVVCLLHVIRVTNWEFLWNGIPFISYPLTLVSCEPPRTLVYFIPPRFTLHYPTLLVEVEHVQARWTSRFHFQIKVLAPRLFFFRYIFSPNLYIRDMYIYRQFLTVCKSF